MLVGFGGRAESGKTTSTELLRHIAQPETHEHIEFSDPIIRVANEILTTDPCLLKDAEFRNRLLAKIIDCLPPEHYGNEEDDYLDSYLEGVESGDKIVDVESKKRHRPLLEWVGRAAIRFTSPDIWGEIVQRKIENAQSSQIDLVTVGGIRSARDCEIVRKCGGAVVKVVRLTNIPVSPTESGIDEWTPDFTIINNGSLENLRHMLVDIWKRLNADQLTN